MDTVDTLVREAIIDTVGLPALLDRTHTVLRDARGSLNMNLIYTCTSLLSFLAMGRTLDIMPYLLQHQLLGIIISAIVHSEPKNGIGPMALYIYTGGLLR